MAVVYVIGALQAGAFKVGITGGDPMSRMATLQTGSPVPLELLGYIEDVDAGVEKYLHDRLRRHRLHGEWFKARPRVLRWLRWLMEQPCTCPPVCGGPVRSPGVWVGL